MKLDEAFPSKYLKAADFPQPQVLTISHLESAKFGEPPNDEFKRVVYFSELDRGYASNITNYKAIIKLTGQEDDDLWKGARVELFKAVVEYKGDLVDAIRVRPPGGWEAWATPSTDTPTETPDESLPF